MDNDTVTTFDIDYGYDVDGATLDQAMDTVIRRWDLHAVELIQLEGPAGGWPVVRLRGPRDNVVRALREGWGLDDDDLALVVPAA